MFEEALVTAQTMGSRAELNALVDAGVDQFNLYLMNGDEEAQLEAYGRDVIPALRP